MSEHSEHDEGKEILSEVIELASEYLSDDLDNRITDAVKKAIIDVLSKYGRNVEGLTLTGGGNPIFVDATGGEKCDTGDCGDCQLDNGTPRGGKHLNTELFQQVLKSMNEDVVEDDTISPTNPLTSSCHSYDEDEKESESKKERKRREKREKKDQKQKGKEAKKALKGGKGSKLDTLIEREDVVNERLNKVAYAFLLNTPGLAQVLMGRQLRQQVIVNNDQKPIPVVIVTELNHSESKETRRKRRKQELQEKLELQQQQEAEKLEQQQQQEAELEQQQQQQQEEEEEEVVLEIEEEELELQEDEEEGNGGTLQGKGSVSGSLIA